jgi:hemerythrin-like domain-containing protein
VIARLLDMAEEQVDRIDRSEAPDLELLDLILRYVLDYPDRFHHPKENLVFARLRARNPGREADVAALLAEHEDLPPLTHRFAELVCQVEADASVPRARFVEEARRYIAVQRAHMARENALVLPAALAELDDEDWAAIDRAAIAVADPLNGGGDPGPFERLRDLILAA